MTTDDFAQPSSAELVDDPDSGPAPVDFTQPKGANAGTLWEETGGRRKMPHPVTGKPTWFTRASKFAGTVASQYTLTEWKIATAVAGVAHNKDLYAKANSEPLPPIEEREKGWWMPWAKIGHDGMDRIGANVGGNLGTAVHRYREQVDAGLLAIEDVPEDWRGHIEASNRIRTALGMEIVHAEAFICNLSVHNGVSGRLDNLQRGPGGMLIIEDLKTGKNVPMGLDEIAIQLAAYANAEWIYDLKARRWLPMPNVRKDVALVTWVPIDRPDEAETIPIDIAWGWAAAITSGWVRGYHNRARRQRNGLRLPLEALAEPERAPDPLSLLPGAQWAAQVLDADAPAEELPFPPRVVELAPYPETDTGIDTGATFDTPEDRAEYHSVGTLTKDGSGPLQPLADRTAGERGCSDCGRKGHRKGSAKCWGPDEAPLPITSLSVPEDVPGPREGKDVDATPYDLGPAYCTCSQSSGWTKDEETDTWVCGACRLPSRAALLHEAEGRPARPAELSGFTAEEAQATLDQHKAAVTEIVDQLAEETGTPGNMFAPEPEMGTKVPTPADRIEAATDAPTLGRIYMELYPEGLWTPELDALAQRRKAEIKGTAPKLRSV